jgi:hypothetical protein
MHTFAFNLTFRYLHRTVQILLSFSQNPSVFSLTFLKKESEAYEITSLSVCLYVCPSVCVSPLITFEPIGRFL